MAVVGGAVGFTMLCIDILFGHSNPYAGILTYLVLPIVAAAGGGMAFEVGIEPPQREHVLARDDADLGPCGVQDRRRVPLRQHETIVVLVGRIARVVPHFATEERRHDLGSGAAGARVTAARLGGREDGVDPQACRDVLQRAHARGRLNWQKGGPPKGSL